MDNFLFFSGLFICIWAIGGSIYGPTINGEHVIQLTKFIIGVNFIYLSYKIGRNEE